MSYTEVYNDVLHKLNYFFKDDKHLIGPNVMLKLFIEAYEEHKQDEARKEYAWKSEGF